MITKKILFLCVLCVFAVNLPLHAQVTKFLEVFDSTNIESRGWSLVNNDASQVEYPLFYTSFEYYGLGTLSQHAGTYFMKFNSLNANENGYIDEWVILPRLTSIEKYDTLSFWCGAVDKNYKDSLRIYISTSDNALSSFTLIDKFKVDGPAGSWHKKSWSLAPYAGKKIYFAVNYHIENGGPFGANSDNVWLDHFSVTNPYGAGVEVNEYSLSQNFPNPFNPLTEIVFSVPQNSKVALKVYNVLGAEIAILASGDYVKGRYIVGFDGANFASGIYFYKLVAGSFIDSKRMVLLK